MADICLDCANSCSASCGSGCATACTTGCKTTCSGYCTGTCSSSCGAACSNNCIGTCAGGCIGTCTSACSSGCTTTCTTTCSAYCAAACTGGCTTTCSGTCSAYCAAACTGGCEGTCSSACSSGCTTSCTGGCLGTCSSSCGAACSSNCTGSCGGGCEGTCSAACSSGCTTTCTGSCTGGCLGTCSSSCGAACSNNCTGSCGGGCEGTCSSACSSGCTTTCTGNCLQTCSSACGAGCAIECTGGCSTTCSGSCIGGCLETCSSTCGASCSSSCTSQVVAPLGSYDINGVPSQVVLGESFTMTGTWANAHHTATSIDGGAWDEVSGSSFSRTITLGSLGQHTIVVAARNTPDADDYQSEGQTVSYTVTVVESTPLPDKLGDLLTNIPTEVIINEAFTISGTCANAHHIATAIDNANWNVTQGEGFTRDVTLTTLGEHEITVSARITEFDTDPGTDSKTQFITVNVLENSSTPELGSLVMTKKVPLTVNFNESFTISGNWANAEEILVSIDDVNWTSYSGDSFEQTLNANFLGVNKIIIVAKNTLDTSDPDYTIETIKYPIKVNSNGVYISSLDSTSVTVKLDLEKYEGREVQLENVNTLEAVTKTPYMSYLSFGNLVSNNPYKIKLIENGTVVSVINFITGVDSIAIENVQQEVNSCNLMSVQY